MPRQPIRAHLLLALLLASTIPARRCCRGEGGCRGSGDQQAAPPTTQQECAWAPGGGTNQSQPPTPGTMLATRPRFVLLGDSLTQRSFDEGGWGAALASAYQRKVDVINRGYSGYTSRWVRPLLAPLFPAAAGGVDNSPRDPPPLLVTVWLGANDAAMAGRASERQHVPLQEFRGNLEAIVAHLRAAGVRNLLLVTPPPLDETARIADMRRRWAADPALLPERTNQVTGGYAEAVREVAAAAGAPALDLFSALPRDEGWQRKYLSDGLHLTPAGMARVYALMQDLIDQALPHLRVGVLPHDFPLHSDLQEEGYQQAIAAHVAAKLELAEGGDAQ